MIESREAVGRDVRGVDELISLLFEGFWFRHLAVQAGTVGGCAKSADNGVILFTVTHQLPVTTMTE